MNESFEKDLTWNSSIYLHGDEHKRYLETQKLLPSDSVSLLDVGTGNGAFLNFLEQNNFQQKISGVEYTSGGIRNKICKCEIVQGSIDSLKYDNHSIDTVCALEVIEHLPVGIYENGLNELERIANKYIVISVPYQENRVNVNCPNCGCAFNPNTHVRSFDEQKMKSLFTHFSLQSLHKLGNKREMYFGKYRKLAKSIFGDKTFPNQCVCPQCFYSKTKNQEKLPASISSKVSTQKTHIKIAKKIFFYNSPRWYLAVYKRNTTT